METILNSTDEVLGSKEFYSTTSDQNEPKQPKSIYIDSVCQRTGGFNSTRHSSRAAFLKNSDSLSQSGEFQSEHEMEKQLRMILDKVGVQVYMKTLNNYVKDKVSGFAQLSKDLLESGYSLNDFIKDGSVDGNRFLFRKKAVGSSIETADPDPMSKWKKEDLVHGKTESDKVVMIMNRKRSKKLKRIKKTRKIKKMKRDQTKIKLRKSKTGEVVKVNPEMDLSDEFVELKTRIFHVLSGKIPERVWIENWSRRTKQIFWLLMNKMWILPEEWLDELKDSHEFPSGRGIPSQKINNILKYSSFVLRDILNLIIYSQDFLETDQATFGDFLLSKIGNVSHLHNHRNFRNLINPCVSTKERLYLGKKYRIVKTKLNFSKTQRTFVFRYLKHYPGIEEIFAKVKATYLENDQFSQTRKKIILSQIALAVKKVDTLIKKECLPATGIDLTRKNKTLMDSIKVSVFLKDWVDYFNWIQGIMSSCCVE